MILSPNLKLGDGSTGIVWDDPPCPLCSGERRTPVVEAPDRMPGGSGLRFAVVRCDECGLHFTSPRPNRATIGQFYGHEQWPRPCPPSAERVGDAGRLFWSILTTRWRS